MMHNIFDSLPSCAMIVQQNKVNLAVDRECRGFLNKKKSFSIHCWFLRVLKFQCLSLSSESLSMLTFTILFDILTASSISTLFRVYFSTIVISVFLVLQSNITSSLIYNSVPINPFSLINVFPETLFLSLPREIVSNVKSLSVFNQPPLQCLASQHMFVAYFINLLLLKANLIAQWNYPISFSSKPRVKYFFGVNNTVQLLRSNRDWFTLCVL